jgi:hypothetical protein
MPIKATGAATEWREIDRWDGGVGWIAHPDEAMQRASHALVDGDDVWVVDPVDAAGLDDFLEDLGTVAGVIVLLDRHTRDAAALARRYDVPVGVPAGMYDAEQTLDAPTEPLSGLLEGSGYGVHTLVDNALWRESALSDEASETLVVAESVGTTALFRTHDERLGVHPARRLFPPTDLRRFGPERILVGHGEGIFEDATGALRDAVAGARRRAPRLYAETVREFLL